MVKNTFSQSLRGTSGTSLPQDIIAIFLSDQRLQFVVADHLGQPHLLREYADLSNTRGTDLLKIVFSEDADIRKAYGNSYLILKDPIALLEPLSFTHDSSDLSQYLLPDSNVDSRLSDRIESSGIKVIYPFEDSAKLFVEQMFPNLTICHHHTLLIQLFDDLSENLPEDKIYTHLEGERLSIFYYKDSKLQYGNQFPVHSDEDRIYYIMLVYQQFALDPSTVMVSTSIGSGLTQKWTGHLRSFLQHIQLLEYQPGSTTSDHVFQDSAIYKQYYFALSSIGLLTRLKSK